MAKTIVEKLNLQKYEKRAVVNLPPESTNYMEGLESYDLGLTNPPYDLIFAFVLDLDSFKQLVHQVIDNKYLNENGYLYIAYPKKGNKVYRTYVHRDELFPSLGVKEDGYVGTSNIKFARMAGLDEIFTVVGLKEESKKNKPKAAKASQSVDDYVDMIPEIEKDLKDSPSLLEFYQSLTEGYRKDWARFVYSGKQEATKDKRREEMKKILDAGYKTRDIYIRANK